MAPGNGSVSAFALVTLIWKGCLVYALLISDEIDSRVNLVLGRLMTAELAS